MADNLTQDYEVSSGNVFADLGLPDPDKDLLKANLVHTIADLIRRKDLGQEEAARILKVDQPKISAIMNGRISGFSEGRLIRFLRLLGYNVHISVDAAAGSVGGISVDIHP